MVKTRSGKTYGKKPEIPLMLLHDVVPKIIGKMHNLELARMRQTCSSINSLVEKRTEILSQRNMTADFEMETEESWINLTINVNDEGNEISLDVNEKPMEFEGDLKEHLGPFTINCITVTDFDSSTEKQEETVQWLRQMRFNCPKLILEQLEVQFAFDILESVENVTEAYLESRFLRLTAEDLHLLSSSRYASVMKLKLNRANLHAVPVDIVKKFREVTIGCYRAQALRNMIEDLESTNDSGNLEKIEYESVYPYDNTEFKIPFPQLWKGEEPCAIYWKELEKKEMVVVHVTSGWDSEHFEFSFIEKGSTDLTDIVMEHVSIKKDIENIFRAKFTEASFEEKCKLLKEAVDQHECRSSGMHDRDEYKPFGMRPRRSAPPSIPQPYSSDTDDNDSENSDPGSDTGSSSNSD